MRTVLKMFYGLVLFFIVNYAGAGVSGQHDATGSDLKLELVQAVSLKSNDRTYYYLCCKKSNVLNLEDLQAWRPYTRQIRDLSKG